MAETLYLLQFDYVRDVLEKRGPHRPGHLATIARFHAEGKIVIAGAVGDPVDSGLLAFRDEADIEAYLAEDPYIPAGLVAAHRVVPWTVVTPLPGGGQG